MPENDRMALNLHDTMSRRLVEVKPLEPGHVRLYTCGPTVYARAHIGNFRTFVFEDVLRRWLDRNFDRVTHVMNLTDVEDKIIRNAVASGHTLGEETAPWIDGFFEDLQALNIRKAHEYPRATKYIDEMIAIIDRLAERGLTYEADGSVYFRVSAFPGYGKLSGAVPSGLMAGASGRVDADEYDKEEARDFALWKSVGADEIGWDTKYGRGRPGWHIECSAMSMSLLGESFDIHCGGVDNIFPHHENEIAQSEGATGEPFVQIWCHSAHLRIGGEKMAKSAGNFSTVHEILDNTDAKASGVRFLLAARAHYRKSLDYTEDALADASAGVERLFLFAQRVREMAPGEAATPELLAKVDSAWQAFERNMDDDLNLPGAMGEVFSLLRDMNRELDERAVDSATRERLLTLIDDVDDIVGVLALAEKEQEGGLAPEVEALLQARVQARQAKEWKKSDEIRDQLQGMGVLVEDTPGGQRWRKA
jgi:cysteinyl-tRNA synthetase